MAVSAGRHAGLSPLYCVHGADALRILARFLMNGKKSAVKIPFHQANGGSNAHTVVKERQKGEGEEVQLSIAEQESLCELLCLWMGFKGSH